MPSGSGSDAETGRSRDIGFGLKIASHIELIEDEDE
jgi:hypothetical protein